MRKKDGGPMSIDPEVEEFLLELTGVADLFGMKPKEDASTQRGQPDEQGPEEPMFLKDDGLPVELPTFVCTTSYSRRADETVSGSTHRR